jgi:hypothetical protein
MAHGPVAVPLQLYPSSSLTTIMFNLTGVTAVSGPVVSVPNPLPSIYGQFLWGVDSSNVTGNQCIPTGASPDNEFSFTVTADPGQTLGRSPNGYYLSLDVWGCDGPLGCIQLTTASNLSVPVPAPSSALACPALSPFPAACSRAGGGDERRRELIEHAPGFGVRCRPARPAALPIASTRAKAAFPVGGGRGMGRVLAAARVARVT